MAKKEGKKKQDDGGILVENVIPDQDTGDQPKKGKAKKAKQHKTKQRSQRYQKSLAAYETQKRYSIDEGLDLVKKLSYGHFDATIEVHFNLNINPQKNEQQIRTNLELPHGTGKKQVIVAFGDANQVKELESLGVVIGTPDTIEKINNGWLDFDVVVAHPSFMSALSKVSRKLGPRGMMPNPKAGTVGENVPEIIKKLLAGRIEIKNQADSSVLHSIIGKVSFSNAQLKENFISLHKALITAKPAKVKEPFIKNCVLSPTMGPSVKIDLTNLLK